MIAYVTVGADDIARAKRFYAAILPALGYSLTEGPEGLSYALPAPPAAQPVVPGHPGRWGRGQAVGRTVGR